MVTRYFGGTLLGTGGLVRAYQKATKEGLQNSVILTKESGSRLTIRADYNDAGKLSHLFSQKDVLIMDSIYTENVTFVILVPEQQKAAVCKEMTEVTSARAVVEKDEEVTFGIADKKAILL